MNKVIKIECPNCGYEYLPSEIFIPNAFFNKPIFINRDSNGKIVNEIDGEMNLSETYVCDNCLNEFTIDANISFSCSLKEKFSTEFVVKF